MNSQPRRPILLPPGAPLYFPDPRRVADHGLLAVGADLSMPRLVLAYRNGIFPWFSPGEPPLWWSPDPRGVLRPDEVHVSRSLGRQLRKGGFSLTWNKAFGPVIQACGALRPEGTWITRSMIRAYRALHRAGIAHSLEVWHEGELSGGIYGVQVGALFAAESMFHRRTGASKIALTALARTAARAGIRLIDVQFLTPHLRSMGATELTRDTYLGLVSQLRDVDVDLSGLNPDWENPRI